MIFDFAYSSRQSRLLVRLLNHFSTENDNCELNNGFFYIFQNESEIHLCDYDDKCSSGVFVCWVHVYGYGCVWFFVFVGLTLAFQHIWKKKKNSLREM